MWGSGTVWLEGGKEGNILGKFEIATPISKRAKNVTKKKKIRLFKQTL